MGEIDAILNFAQKYGIELIIGLWLLIKVVNNAGKIFDRLAKLSPPFSRWLEERRIERGVITSAELSAKIEHDEATLHHDLDSEAANQAYLFRQQSELLAMLKETFQHFWEDKTAHETRDNERWEKVLAALVKFDRVLSINTQTVERQATEYGQLDCVKAARRAALRRKTNGE